MLRLKEEADVAKKLAKEPAEGPKKRGQTTDSSQFGSVEPSSVARPAHITRFFETYLRYAEEHCDFRRSRCETREHEMHGIVTGDVPANVLAEVSSGSLW